MPATNTVSARELSNSIELLLTHAIFRTDDENPCKGRCTKQKETSIFHSQKLVRRPAFYPYFVGLFELSTNEEGAILRYLDRSYGESRPLFILVVDFDGVVAGLTRRHSIAEEIVPVQQKGLCLRYSEATDREGSILYIV